MKNLIAKLLRQKPTNEEAIVLFLKYKDYEIGKLWSENGKYYFRYDDNFKTTNLRPLTGFEKLDEVYESPRLFPYFEVRIPDLNREDMAELVRAKHLDTNSSPLRKLAVFGQKTINDPYILTLEPA
jgi:hypothetical protein